MLLMLSVCLVDQLFVSAIQQYERLILYFDIGSTIDYTQLLYELGVLDLIKCLCQAIGCLRVSTDLLDNYVAISKFLLNILKTGINISCASIG